MTQNRKRGRNLHEDETEFMPLSKRINNLHINNSLMFEQASMPPSLAYGEWGPGPPYTQQPVHIHPLPETPPGSVQPPDWANPQYAPELDEAQNPHYFRINKLLFEMYMERVQRNNLV